MTVGLTTMAGIYAEVAGVMVDTGNAAFTTALIDNAWYAAELLYVMQTRYLVKRGTAIAIADGDLTFSLPSDCMELKALTLYTDSKEYKLEPSTEEKFDDAGGEWRDSDGEPSEFAVRPPLTGVFNCKADTTYSVYPYYVYQPDSSTMPNIPLEHRDNLLDFVLWKAFRQKMEWSTASEYQKSFYAWLKTLEDRSNFLTREYLTVRDVRNLDYAGY